MINKERIESPLFVIFAVLSVFGLCTPVFAEVPDTLQQSVTYNSETITLIQSDLSITKISNICGFTAYANFSRLFKKYKGTTPTNYRQRHKTNSPQS